MGARRHRGDNDLHDPRGLLRRDRCRERAREHETHEEDHEGDPVGHSHPGIQFIGRPRLLARQTDIHLLQDHPRIEDPGQILLRQIRLNDEKLPVDLIEEPLQRHLIRETQAVGRIDLDTQVPIVMVIDADDPPDGFVVEGCL